MKPPGEWDRVLTTLDAIAAFRPESADDFEQADPAAVEAARKAATRYAAVGHPLPADVFMIPDGGVMFLWVTEGGSHHYDDYAPGGRVQRMTTFKDGRPAVFVDLPEGVSS